MQFSLLLLVAYLSMAAMMASLPSERSKKLSALVYNSIADLSKLDLAMANKVLGQFKEDDVLCGKVGDTVPVLHHLFNIYRLAPTDKAKSDVVNVLLSCMQHGADPADVYNADPPLLYKIVLMKELHLAREAIVSSPRAVVDLVQGAVRWSAGFLSNLYAIPSETVPLVKLLLYADTLVRTKGLDTLGGLAGLRRLLNSAGLGKPTVKPVDLDRHSSTYATVAASLGGEQGQIRLLDMVRCLDEMAAAVHGVMLDALLQAPAVEGQEATVVQLVRVIAGVGAEGSALEESPYGMRRNALHYLGLSGSVVMVEQLVDALRRLQSAVAVDKEGTGQAFASAHSKCVELLAQALQAVDDRGHSPVSYAVMRFSPHSPSVTAVRSLCDAVGVSFDTTVEDAQGRGVLRSDNRDATVSAAASASGEVLGNGGWDTAPLPGLEAALNSGTVDGRVLEVHAPTLPSNAEFFRKYLNTGTPVVFRQVTAPSPPAHRSSSTSALRSVFERAAFLSRYGNITVPAATIPYAGTFGVQQLTSTMSAVANAATLPSASSPTHVPLYTFCTPSPQWAGQLLADVPVPACIARNQSLSATEDCGVGAVDAGTASWSFEVQFYLGAAGTGAPVHFHGHAINSLAYGEKHWLLYPPAQAFYSTTPARRLFDQHQSHSEKAGGGSEAARASPIRVVQRAGDVLFVPALWGHATLNAQQSIGVAHEFTVESFCME